MRDFSSSSTVNSEMICAHLTHSGGGVSALKGCFEISSHSPNIHQPCCTDCGSGEWRPMILLAWFGVCGRQREAFSGLPNFGQTANTFHRKTKVHRAAADRRSAQITSIGAEVY